MTKILEISQGRSSRFRTPERRVGLNEGLTTNERTVSMLEISTPISLEGVLSDTKIGSRDPADDVGHAASGFCSRVTE